MLCLLLQKIRFQSLDNLNVNETVAQTKPHNGLPDSQIFINNTSDFFLSALGDSMKMGNTFWQSAFGKSTKTYLDRAFFQPSIELLTPRSRA